MKKLTLQQPEKFQLQINNLRTVKEALATKPLSGKLFLRKNLISQDPNRNKMAYPTINWFDELLEDYTLNSRFNFNVSGGGKIARYYGGNSKYGQ